MVETETALEATHTPAWLDDLLPRIGGPAFEAYVAARAISWSHTAVVPCTSDRRAFLALDPARRRMLERNLLFFAFADKAVIDLLTHRVADLVAHRPDLWKPTLDMGGVELFINYHRDIEGVHTIVYRRLLEDVVRTSDAAALEAVKRLPGVVAKLQRMTEIGQTDDVGELVFLWMLSEGLFLQETFACILYFSPGDFPAVVDANRRIRDDENTHAEFAALLFRMLRERPTAERLRAIVASVIDVCDAYIADVLPVSLPDLSPTMLGGYARFRADVLLGRVGEPPLYGVANPLPWLEMNGLATVVNPHETRPYAYVVSTGRAATGAVLSLDDC